MGKVKKKIKLGDIHKDTDQLAHIDVNDLMPLPKPLDGPERVETSHRTG